MSNTNPNTLGTTQTDCSFGKPVTVAKTSYDPGYDLSNSLPYASEADLKQGYTSYGKAIGEGSGSRGR